MFSYVCSILENVSFYFVSRIIFVFVILIFFGNFIVRSVLLSICRNVFLFVQI